MGARVGPRGAGWPSRASVQEAVGCVSLELRKHVPDRRQIWESSGDRGCSGPQGNARGQRTATMATTDPGTFFILFQQQSVRAPARARASLRSRLEPAAGPQGAGVSGRDSRNESLFPSEWRGSHCHLEGHAPCERLTQLAVASVPGSVCQLPGSAPRPRQGLCPSGAPTHMWLVHLGH